MEKDDKNNAYTCAYTPFDFRKVPKLGEGTLAGKF
jgi:hypothetical protein